MTKRVEVWIAVLAGAWGLVANAAIVEAKRCDEAIVLKGDQTGTTIRIASGYLPARWESATAIYAKGKPKFATPRGLHVRSAGEGWWEVFRRDEPCVFTWTGAGGNSKWENARNWSPAGIPGRLDSVKLTEEATIDLGRDQMVSNLFFSAKVILGGAAIHAQRTVGRGPKGKLGVRVHSLLGEVKTSEGAQVLPLRGTAGYKGLLKTDEIRGVAHVVETRPAAKYVWTGAGKDGKWTNVKNWQANGRPAVESPTDVDSVVIGKAGEKGKLEIELPWGVSVVSNLVMNRTVTWRRERKATEVLDGEDAAEANAALPCLDVFDLTGNEEFIVRGEVQFCAKGVNTTGVPLVAEKGTRLALAAHNHVPYKSVTIEGGATLLPFDYAVEFERLVLKPGHAMSFGAPRFFNRWRPVWVMHAKNLTGEPAYPKIPGWHQHVEKFNDGSTLLAIGFGE